MARDPVSPESPSGRSPRVVGFRLLHRGREIPIESGQYTIGRGSGCDVVLDDPIVSRLHARLIVNDTTALLEDLRSEHGVFVNEVRIRRSVRLGDGDRILIGGEEITFVVGAPDTDAERSSGTIEVVPPSSAPLRIAKQGLANEVSTLEADAFEYLGHIAEKMLRSNRGATAERLLKGHLTEVLSASQKPGAVGRDVADAASANALKLALGLRRAAWVDFVVELHLALRVPPCPAVVLALRSIVRELTGFDRDKWRAYERALVTDMPSLSAQDQAAARAFLWIEEPE